MLPAKYQCIPASGSWEEDFLKIYQNVPYFDPYWAQRGPAPLFEQIWIPIFPPSLVEIG